MTPRLVVAGLVLAIAAAGCARGSSAGASGGASSAAGRTSTVSTSAPTAARATKVPGSRGQFSASLGIGKCRARNVQVSLDVQPPTDAQGPDWTRALVVVADASAGPCTVGGFARVRFLRGKKTVLLSTRRDVTTPHPPRVTVRTGVSGFASIGWVSGPDCTKIGGFDVTLPGDSAPVSAAVNGAMAPLDMCQGGAAIGPFVSTVERSTPVASSAAG